MRSRVVLVSAMGSCVAMAAAAALAQDQRAATLDRPQDRTVVQGQAQGVMFPQGISPKQLNDQQDIRKVLASSTNAAVVKGGLDDMVERFSTSDRKRLNEFVNRDANFAELDGRIEQIRKNWQQKYGKEFDLNHDEIFQNFVTIQEGEVTDAMQAKSQWPVSARSSRDAGNVHGMHSDRDTGITGATGTDRTAGRTDTGRIDTGRTDTGMGHTGTGTAHTGAGTAQPGVNDTVRPNAPVPDPALTGTPDVRNPNTRADDARVDNARVGDKRVGDTKVGDTRIDDTRVGDARVGDTRVGDVRVGDTRVGDVRVNTGAGTADYLENGRNVAIASVAASHGLPGINVSLVHEPVDDWRIDIPDNITGQQLHDNVKAALTSIGDNVASWPADANEAYRMVAHRLLLAAYNVPQAGDFQSAGVDSGTTDR